MYLAGNLNNRGNSRTVLYKGWFNLLYIIFNEKAECLRRIKDSAEASTSTQLTRQPSFPFQGHFTTGLVTKGVV